MSSAVAVQSTKVSPSVDKSASTDIALEKRSISSNVEGLVPARATSLLNLEVKVLTQALGVENQWVERGDGRVEFTDLTIRVLSSARTDNLSQDENSGITGAPKKSPASEDGVSSSASTVDDHDLVDTVILEDTITCDTPFVGENCCIVWNSFEQQLSLCLMYASEEGYGASWSALVALQEKAYPPLRFDLLESCRPVPATPGNRAMSEGDAVSTSEGGDATTAAEDGKAQKESAPGDDITSSAVTNGSSSPVPPGGEPLPYRYFIHTMYKPPLGFIEMHALSLSILENHHTDNPKLFESRDTVIDMLRLASADLLDHLLTAEVFPRLLKGVSPGISDARDTDSDEDFGVPDSLTKLEVPENLAAFISKERRLRKLQSVVIPTLAAESTGGDGRGPKEPTSAKAVTPITTATTRDPGSELLLKLSAMTHRLRNEIVCTLLSSDTTLLQARDALTVAPPPGATGGSFVNGPSSGPRGRVSSGSVSSMHSLRSNDRTPSPSNAPPMPLPTLPSAAGDAQKVEKSVLAHLRFFRSLMVVSMIELGRELVGPVIAKIYHFELLEALSLVAERFAMPAGTTAVFLAKLRETGSGGGGNDDSTATQAFPSSTLNRGSLSATTMNSSSTLNTALSSSVYYSPAIEAELTAFLDATLVRLNERQEERLMNELVRAPILADPVKYNGIMTFALRQALFANSHSGTTPSALSAGCGGVQRPFLRDTPGVRNTLLLFHLLGLHDDEGSAAVERTLDPAGTELRDAFHTFVVDKYLMHTMRGQVAIPPPPSLPTCGVAAGGTALSNRGAASTAASAVVSPKRIPLTPGSSTNGTSSHASSTASGNNNNNNAIVVFSNISSGAAAGMGHHHADAVALSALPAGLSPGLISVLSYLVQLGQPATRDRVLRLVFDSKSNVLNYMEMCCSIAVNNKSKVLSTDVLVSQVGFLRNILTQVCNSCGDDEEKPSAANPIGGDGSPLPSFDSPEPLPANLISLICRQLTVERDTLWYYLRAFNTLGGRRRHTLFHSSFLALLELIVRGSLPRGEPAPQEEAGRRVASEDSTFRDLRDFVFFKHEHALPERFTKKVRESLLSEVCARLGCEDAFSSCNNSTSALSSTISSEMLRSSVKLRFVDELEAATGGVDGTVAPNTVTSLSPAVVASVSAEEKRRKLNSGARGATLEEKLHNSAANSAPMRTAAGAPLQTAVLNPSALATGSTSVGLRTPPKNPAASSSSSPLSTSRNAPDVRTVAKQLSLSSSPPSHEMNVPPSTASAGTAPAPGGAASPGVLQPSAPKGEKPASRPRKLTGGHEDDTATARRPNSAGGGSPREVSTTPGDASSGTSSAAASGTVPPLTRPDSSSSRGGKGGKNHQVPHSASATGPAGAGTPPIVKAVSASALPTGAAAGKDRANSQALVLPRVRKTSE